MRSVAKGNYIKGKGGIKHALAHVRYLQMRGGDDRDITVGRKRLFIDANREAISGNEVSERIKKQDENKVVIHRIVLSPGVEGVDMAAYTRAIMSEFERSKGLDIEYYATEHKNTDHDHTHVILLGRDQHGRQVTLNRSNYKTIREAGDRYLERHHRYDRLLDKDLDVLMRDGYKHDRGDRDFESLLKDLTNPHTSEEWDEQPQGALHEFEKDFAIKTLPASEKIARGNIIYSKYSSLDELIELDKKLNSYQIERVSKEKYLNLCSWIGNKKQFGDDYYEKTAEEIRIFQQFEDDFRRSISTDNSPPKSFCQYVFESRGRLLDSHERYTIDIQRLQLQNELKAIAQSGDIDTELRQGLIEQLDWLDTMMHERIQSRKEIPRFQRSDKSDSSMPSVPTNESKIASGKPQEQSADLSRFEHQEQDESKSSIHDIIFGGDALYEKSEIEQQIDLWHKIAFDSDFNGYLSEQKFLPDRDSDQVQLQDHQSLELIMQLQVQRILQEQIKESFYESQQQIRSPAGAVLENENKENEREDFGREH